MINVLLVDDHKLIRAGIRRILDDTPGIQVVGEAESGEQALDVAKQMSPHVVLMDVNMPGIGGLEATRKLLLQRPESKVIAVSVLCDEPYPAKLLEAGAAGYLTKDCSASEVVQAIKRVHAGERYLAPEIAKELALSLLNQGKASPFDQLSQREMQVMMMVTQGQSIQEISDRLFLSPKTVSTYRYRLFEKLNVNNDVELTRLAMRHGLLDDGN